MPRINVNSDPPKPTTFEDLGYVQVVRCKDCIFALNEQTLQDGFIICTKPYTERGAMVKSADWFCADGERRTDDA